MDKGRTPVWVNIDGGKIKEELKKKGVSIYRASQELGCGHDIENAIRRGKMRFPLAVAISAVYSIPLHAFEAEEAPEQQKTRWQEIKIAPTISDEQWERLESVIFNAVSKALKG